MVFEASLGHLVRLFRNGLQLEMADRAAKRLEIWSSWVLVEHICGTFEFKVILWSSISVVLK